MAVAATETQKKEFWFCESCTKVGSVLIDPHAGVMTVVYQSGDSHQEVSPSCTQSVYGVRVLDKNHLAKEPQAYPDWVHEQFKTLAG